MISGLAVTGSMVWSRNACDVLAVERRGGSGGRCRPSAFGLLDQVHGEALVRDGQRGGHARDAAADDQCAVVDRNGLVL